MPLVAGVDGKRNKNNMMTTDVGVETTGVGFAKLAYAKLTFRARGLRGRGVTKGKYRKILSYSSFLVALK